MSTENGKFNKLLSDEEIIELYWQRNEDAIGATDTKYGKYLFTLAYNIVGYTRIRTQKKIPK